ncbi:MAG: metal ABC transporter permease [Verrucomicrobiota bacterium]|nr:metal ABC transporter permease [Verrucomicrobiota bacterium]
MNPYWDTNLFSFFLTLLSRLFSGALFTNPAADEIQLGTLSLVAFSCGLLSPFLVLKRMSMFANALSHTVLLGIALAFLLSSALFGATLLQPSTLFIGALLSALLTALLTEGTTRLFRLQEESSVGLIFSLLFALGVIITTLFTRHIHLGVEAVLGNADALQRSDLFLSGLYALLSLGTILLFFRPLQISIFDRSFALLSGLRPQLLHFLLLFLTAGLSVSAFRAIGLLLVLSFLTGPYLIARLFCHRLSLLLILTPAIGIALSLLGIALSRHLLSLYDLPLSTGGITTSLIALTWLVLYFARAYIPKRKSYSITHNSANL